MSIADGTSNATYDRAETWVSSEFRDALAARYRIEREIGRGGAAVVFLARDLRHDRDVAIKVFRRDLKSAVDAERFAQEIRTAAGFIHPHILPVHDSGEAAGCLFYVMPFVEKGTLRDRLRQSGALPLPEALAIIQEVGDALSFAHAHGLIHRDVKPENVLLLSGEHVCVADFGLVRPASRELHLTSQELTVGTPLYMSPEQADGSAVVDARSDQYSLACLLYELLTGTPPYEGATVLAVIQKHLASPVPSVRDTRPDIPLDVDRAIRQAMAKDRARRYDSIDAFLAALGVARGTSDSPALAAPRRRMSGLIWRTYPASGLAIGVALTIVLVALGWLLVTRTPSAESALDDARVVVFPFTRSGVSPDALPAEQLLFDALSRWDDLRPVDLLVVEDRSRAMRGVLTHAAAIALAREFGARRFVRGDLRRMGDSIRVYAALYDAAREGAPTAEGTTRLAAQTGNLDDAFALLADALLFRSTDSTRQVGTRSVLARRAYLTARTHLRHWKVAAADAALSEALAADRDYATANLWKAQVRLWSGDLPSAGQFGTLALAPGARLRPAEQALARAVARLAGGQYQEACRDFERLVAADSLNFSAWVGLGECHRRDRVVLRDATSPSGWRFRGSGHRSLQAFQHALRLLPSSGALFRAEGFRRLRNIFFVSANAIRTGQPAGDTALFAAYPSWDTRGDSLVFIPYPASAFASVGAGTRAMALTRATAWLMEYGRQWVRVAPRDPVALEALALALDLGGQTADALAAVQRARSLATEPEHARNLQLAEIRLRLRDGLAGRPEQLDTLRQLATDVLAAPGEVSVISRRAHAAIAVLLGRPALAHELMRPIAGDSTLRRFGAPAALSRGTAAEVERLRFLVASGAPAAAVTPLWASISSAIGSEAADAAPAVRAALVRRLGSLAFPVLVLPGFSQVPPNGNDLVEAQQAALRGEHARVRAALDTMRRRAAEIPGGERTADAVLAEAHLYLAVGDSIGAARWIDRWAEAAARVSSEALASDADRASAIPRLALLRAQLAERAGDVPLSQRWGRVAAALFAEAEPLLRPQRDAARRLAAVHR